MTEDIDLPESLMGTHITSAVDIRMAVQEILEHHLPSISRHRDDTELELENMPSILIAEADMTITVYVPLPYLHHADVTTDQLQRALRPCIAAGAKFEVKIHPGSDHDIDGATNPLDKYHS